MLSKGDCLPLTENGSRNWVGMIPDSGFGEEKTLNSHSRFGCAEVDRFGFLAPGSLMYTGDTPVPPAIAAPWPTSSAASRPHSGTTRELSKPGSTMNIKNISTQENHWPDTSTWEISANS